MDHLQPVNSTLHNVQMVSVGSVSSIPTSVSSLPGSVQLLKTNEQLRFHEPVAHYGARPLYASMLNSVGYMIPSPNYSGIQQLDVPNHEPREMGPKLSNHRLHQVQMSVKREFPTDNVPGFPRSPRSPMPNKKPRQMDNRPWLNTMLASNKNSHQFQVQSAAGVLSSQQFVTPNKTIQLHATPAKSGSQKATTPRSHPTQGQLSQKAQNESNESVRSKLRESISAALALVTEKLKSSTIENESCGTGATTSELVPESSKTAEIASSNLVAENTGEIPKEATGNCPTQKENAVGSEHSFAASNVAGSTLTDACVDQELNMIDLLPGEEESLAGSFFGKDDLLQGNGLSWVLDFDAWVADKEGHDIKKHNIGGLGEVKRTNTPQSLALKIELELFKLFGGVNKKYKEKGRSLLFNLKDKNNPELREKVMAGEISPARLCSMTAEELASKELTEWRIAKAEEFEQMKILPDSDIDIRRLVRKTHKGEFQVEVEEDDVSVEVSVGSSSLPQVQTQDEKIKAQPDLTSNVAQEGLRNEKNSSEKHDAEYTLTIPSIESTDLMQGLIEDELKDAEFLPPIVSLDEFMESLHSEPPFENLPEDAEKAEASLDNDPSDGALETKSAKHSPDSQTNATSKAQEDLDVKDQTPSVDADTDDKSVDYQPQPAVSPPVALLKEEPLWEGSLQLSMTSSIAVSGFFNRGEKARTKDWPQTLEIKGRVRLDAFEKFLQDLFKSRSRSIMVMHVILKDGSKEREALSQVEDSYVADDRVGFAEPLKGVEVYLCPHHPKILDRVGKHLAKDQTEALTLSGDEKGFVGVIVWRKAHVSPPNSSSSHHKHSYKKHQQEHYSSSRRHNHHHQDRNINVNASSSNLAPKHPVVPLVSSKTSSQSAPIKAAVEDDLPPGFGTQASQDDDDLPEFSFSGGLSRSVPAQKPAYSQRENGPTDQMRHLIQKYGQTAANAGPVSKSWKDDDDDDDIPEWQPQVPLVQPTPVSQHNFQPLNQPMLQHLINQQQQRLDSPMHQTQAALLLQNGAPTWTQQQQTSVWMNPEAPQQGQYYGSQSRGF